MVCFIGPEKPQWGEVNYIYITLQHIRLYRENEVLVKTKISS